VPLIETPDEPTEAREVVSSPTSETADRTNLYLQHDFASRFLGILYCCLGFLRRAHWRLRLCSKWLGSRGGHDVRVWVDADACPVPVKNIVCKAADRREVMAVFLANHWISVPPSAFVSVKLVAKGFDVADAEIMQLVSPGDLVITQDIPLASEIVQRQCVAINPRGTLYTPDNMHGHLVRRNRAEEMRAMGFQSGGAEPFGTKHTQAFAQTFDRVLTQLLMQDQSRR